MFSKELKCSHILGWRIFGLFFVKTWAVVTFWAGHKNAVSNNNIDEQPSSCPSRFTWDSSPSSIAELKCHNTFCIRSSKPCRSQRSRRCFYSFTYLLLLNLHVFIFFSPPLPTSGWKKGVKSYIIQCRNKRNRIVENEKMSHATPDINAKKAILNNESILIIIIKKGTRLGTRLTFLQSILTYCRGPA